MTDPTVPELVDDGGDHPVVPWLNERRRAYFYRLLLALAVAGGLLGIAAPVVGAIVVTGTALLGTGMAAAHTSTKSD